MARSRSALDEFEDLIKRFTGIGSKRPRTESEGSREFPPIKKKKGRFSSGEHGRAQWQDAEEGAVPENAFSIDDDDDYDLGFPAHVGVVQRDDEHIPGMLLPGLGVVGVSLDESDVLNVRTTMFTEKRRYKVLLGTQYRWVPFASESFGRLHESQAVCAGESYDGKAIFVGRCTLADMLVVGRVFNDHLVVQHDGRVKFIDNFDVLLCVE